MLAGLQKLGGQFRSFDVLVFGLLLTGYMVAFAAHLEDKSQSAAFVILASGVVLLYALLKNPSARLLLAYMAIGAIVIAPTILGIYLRHTTLPYQYAHDGMIQVEEATKFLLKCQNPYAENYLNTPLAQWWVPSPNEPVNPALYHLVYLPFLFVFTAPFYVMLQASLGWFDERMLLLPIFLCLLLLLPNLTRKRERMQTLLVFVGLSPWLVPYLVEGRNDVFVLFWAVLSVVLLEKRQRAWSVIALAFACATKQSAWLLLPFYAFRFLGTLCDRSIGEREHWDTTLRLAVPYLVLFTVVFATIVLPFMVWNPHAFIDDVIRYPAGLTDHRYPMTSLGFGKLALALGWITDSAFNFPFGVLQMVFGLPALVLMLRFQGAQNTLSRMWQTYGAFSLIIGFFSYTFNDSQLGYFCLILAMGFLIDT